MNNHSAVSKSTRNSSLHQSFGRIQDWKQTETGLEGKSDFARFRITIYEKGIIRIQASKFDSFESNPYAVISQPEQVDFSLLEKNNELQLSTSLIQLNLD